MLLLRLVLDAIELGDQIERLLRDRGGLHRLEEVGRRCRCACRRARSRSRSGRSGADRASAGLEDRDNARKGASSKPCETLSMWPARSTTVTGSPRRTGSVTRIGSSAGISDAASARSVRLSFSRHQRSRWATSPGCFANRSSGIPLRRHASRTPRASTSDHFPCAIGTSWAARSRKLISSSRRRWPYGYHAAGVSQLVRERVETTGPVSGCAEDRRQ